MPSCYIIGAGETRQAYISPEASLVIAADGGLRNMGGRTPDIVVGDFDSLGFVPEGDNVIRLPIEKDVTDTAFAVTLGEERGFDTFIIYGGTGGRPDHTFANIALLADLAKRGKRGFLIGEGFIITAARDGEISLEGKAGDTVSVFAFGGDAYGVTLEGLKYPLKDYTLKSEVPLGVSNAFLDEKALISVKSGTIILMWQQENLKKFIDKLN